MKLLMSNKSGLVESCRDYVILGRERHVANARNGNLPYPQRAIRTREFLYIRNFKPERWPMGNAPGFGQPDGPFPVYEELEQNTFSAFGDFDASPTKAWILTHRKDTGMSRFVDFAVGRRPDEELYDLGKDPHQMKNLAEDPAYKEVHERLESRLMSILRSTKDPRVTGDSLTYERSPFTDPE
jgi:uncharacterized sulfatase